MIRPEPAPGAADWTNFLQRRLAGVTTVQAGGAILVRRNVLCASGTLRLRMDWYRRLRDRFAKRREHQTRYWDKGGLYAAEGEARLHIGWSDVRQVHSYKKDCLTFDQVRLLVLSDQTGIEFSEDDPYFTGLCTFISEKLGIPGDWYTDLIATAPFDTAFITLYNTSPASTTQTTPD